MFGKSYRQRVRHKRLMHLASALVSPFEQPAVPVDLVALAFGRYQLEVTEEEAARYLDAALVDRGERLPRPAGVDEPEPDAEAESPASAEASGVEAAPAS
ncbi:hypothetical protein [Streptomyces prasinus]|uniref:hypothetical protein n=1 Tax=Streptomyces prasinus TaxID=67345 RepID=UPI0006EB936A|nr:hypothetical protein [Streptomyces prasinus]